MVVVGIVAVVVGVISYHRVPAGASAAEKGSLASLGARMLRGASDFDRDGASSLLGGGDCAPFDARRNPSQPEIYDNGIDEDCSGSDETTPIAVTAGRRVLFSSEIQKRATKKYNVVWIVIDAARADHVSFLGYAKPTTPNLDALAKHSLVFTRAFSQSSATALSFPSMLTGKNPDELRWWIDVEQAHASSTKLVPQVASSETLLAERLAALGYDTGAILSSYTIMATPHLSQGFGSVVQAGRTSTGRTDWTRLSPLVTSRAIDWLAEHATRETGNQPVFLLAYYPDPHSAYTRHRDLVSHEAFSPDEIGKYDTELAFVDQHLQVLLQALEARPFFWQDTILVITADHGDEFREHGNTSHAKTCHIESVHVPLIVRIPGVEPRRIDTPVALVDVVPTILELLGATENGDDLSGQSLLVPTLAPESIWPDRPIFCSVASQNDTRDTWFRRTVRQSGLALFQDVHRGRFSLFDERTDPTEQHDVIDATEYAPRVDRLKALLRDSSVGNLNDSTGLERKSKN